MMLSFYIYKQSSNIRTVTENSIEYIIAPVIMMVQGVHSGSGGALLHTNTVLGGHNWDGVPVVINHPQDALGQYISADSTEVWEQSGVGKIKNSKLVDNKLVGEAWIEKSLLQSKNPSLLQRIESNEIIEVSVGSLTTSEPINGTFNGEDYTGIVHNMIPDHLALLPSQTGACSVKDGCGIRVYNQNNKYVSDVNKKEQFRLDQDIPQIVAHIDLSFNEIEDQMRGMVNKMDSDSNYHYIEEVFEDYFIYRKVDWAKSNERSEKRFKQRYKINDDGKIELKDDPYEVIKEIRYIPVPAPQPVANMKRTKFNNNSNAMTVKEKIDSLITANTFGECDRGMLETLSEEALDKISAKLSANKKEVIADPKGEEKKEEKKATVNTEMSWEDMYAKFPKQVREQMEIGLATYNNAQAEVIQRIISNTGTTWTEDQLKAMPFDTLQKIDASIFVNKKAETPESNYALFGGIGQRVVNAAAAPSVKPMLPNLNYVVNKKG